MNLRPEESRINRVSNCHIPELGVWKSANMSIMELDVDAE